MTNLYLLDLPLDVLYNILSNLNITDFRNVMLTCKKLRKVIIEDTMLWKRYSTNGLLIEKTRSSSYNDFNWYNKCRLSHNWCKGIYRNKIVLQHNINYMPWLRLWGQYLILSVGSELRCYPTTNKGLPVCKRWLWKVNELHKPTYNLNGRSKLHDISRFKIRRNNLVCGNRDGSLLVYSFNDIKCKPQLLHQVYDCHDRGDVEVSAVDMVDKKLFTVISSSYKDPYIKFWQNDYHHNRSLKCVQEISLLECLGAKSLCLNSKQDKLAVGLDGNRRPIIIDTETGAACVNNSHKEVSQVVRDIEWHDENTVIFVTHSGHLQCMDVRNSQIVYSATDPFLSSLYCVRSDGRYAVVVGAAQYARCVLYDIRTATGHKQMYFTLKKCSPVYSVDFDATTLVAAADRSVTALDFNISVQNIQPRNYTDVFQVV